MSTNKNITRRDFFKKAAIAGVGAATVGLAGCSTPGGSGNDTTDITWDLETDVVIIGYGFTGACAAITALEGGASVTIIDKAPAAGGSSRTSVGMIHTAVGADNVDDWKNSRIAQLFGTVPDATVKAFVDEQFKLPDWFKNDLGAELNLLNLPGRGQAAQLKVDGKPTNGKGLFEFLSGKAEEKGAKVILSCPAVALIRKPGSNEIIGVEVMQDGASKNFKAKKAVVLACGGYENNPAMQADFHWPGIPFVPWGTPYNTGDGLKLAIDAGADLWHWQNFEYAGIAPKKAYDELPNHDVFSLNYNSKSLGMVNKTNSFMIVNLDGNRFFDESVSVTHQKSTVLHFNDFSDALGRYINYPFFFICDEARIQSGPLAPPLKYGDNLFTYSSLFSDYKWSEDNSAELNSGWITKADSIDDLANKLGINADGLKATLTAFNQNAQNATDPVFGRPAANLAPLTPPFYGLECLVSVINTMGGPKRNELSQILDFDSKPIPRLYGGGEFGSLNGGVLYTIGNICEAITSGKVAGEQISALNPWDAA